MKYKDLIREKINTLDATLNNLRLAVRKYGDSEISKLITKAKDQLEDIENIIDIERDDIR